MGSGSWAKIGWIGALGAVALGAGCADLLGADWESYARAGGGGDGGQGGAAAGTGGEGGNGTSVPPSCATLDVRCGPARTSCCDSKPVDGGAYDRSYEGVSEPANARRAVVSSFRLDTYEITVGRFLEFVEAGKGTQADPPEDNAGDHPALPESGWRSGWNGRLREPDRHRGPGHARRVLRRSREADPHELSTPRRPRRPLLRHRRAVREGSVNQGTVGPLLRCAAPR
ncbi:hypothetical protein [Sorangium cellulosum]|uniref:hypothetical protein n=1 Tax=Sorangium cellulosum TaxID=56 RepID=UPI000AAB68A5|nr:hypothetical protein [Sorangium cellulosum]